MSITAWLWTSWLIVSTQHQAKAKGSRSEFLPITASIIQGSGIGPVAYILNASDLHPVHQHNMIFKYAGDTYLIVPDIFSRSCKSSLWSENHPHSWSYGIIFTWCYSGNSHCPAHICCPGLVGIFHPSWEGPDPICHKNPNATVICLAITLMSLALLMLLKPTYSAPYCVILSMFSTN